MYGVLIKYLGKKIYFLVPFDYVEKKKNFFDDFQSTIPSSLSAKRQRAVGIYKLLKSTSAIIQ